MLRFYGRVFKAPILYSTAFFVAMNK